MPLARRAWPLFALLLVAAPGSPRAQEPQPPPPAADVTPDPWPKRLQEGGVTYTVFQPQLDSWDGYRLAAHAAVSVLPDGSKDATFGVVDLTAVTVVDRVGRAVSFDDVKVVRSSFPSAPADADRNGAHIQTAITTGVTTMSLDRLEQSLRVIGAEKLAAQVPVRNDPPRFVVSQVPAMLVLVDGDPVLRPVPGTSLSRVLNTRALLLRDAGGTYHVHVWDGWLGARSLDGPWVVERKAPPGGEDVARQLAATRSVDLLSGSPDEQTKKMPSLANGPPVLFVATRPTELIVTQGAPDYVPIDGTNLLYATNTTGNLLVDLQDQRTYVLVTGRWFSAPDLGGPWTYVPGRSLPPDFAKVPDGSPKENMKASVPGTPQAASAVIAAGVPQTATVDRAKASFTPSLAGAPELRPIPGTSLQYVANSPDPIIRVSATEWYSLYLGIWFTAASPGGPWLSASMVPASIYSIPPSSPLFYVTSVKIYAADPGYVTVGYTPGYMGEVVTPDGVVVYGTGYVYPAWVGATVWIPPPVTYGYAVNMAWTPWTGWAMGFGFGLAVGAAMWGPAPYWGPAAYGWHGAAWGPGGAAAWGPNGWAATTGNVYHQWGSTGAVTRTSGGFNAWSGNAWSSNVAHSYNSTTGRMSAGQRGTVENVYTGNYAHGSRGATYDARTGTGAAGERVTVGNAATGKSETFGAATVKGPGGQTTRVAQAGNEYYGDHDGNVYRYDAQNGSFQQHDAGGGWSDATPQRSEALQSEQEARTRGDQRSAGASWSHDGSGGSFDRGGAGMRGGSRSWGGGGFRGGGFRR
ncbi:MAG: hypothetical protein WB493_03150 [Anaeromyxobacteraceae bacterium]